MRGGDRLTRRGYDFATGDRGGDPVSLMAYHDAMSLGPVFRRRIVYLHDLGPRPLGEFLAELIATHPEIEGDLHQRLAGYARLDPDSLTRLGAQDFPSIPLHTVAS